MCTVHDQKMARVHSPSIIFFGMLRNYCSTVRYGTSSDVLYRTFQLQFRTYPNYSMNAAPELELRLKLICGILNNDGLYERTCQRTYLRRF